MAVVTVAACDAPDGPDGRDQLIGPNQGMEANGRDLLGEELDLMRLDLPVYLSATTGAIDAQGRARRVTFTGGASLQTGDRRGTDKVFAGMILDGPDDGQIRISPVRGGTDIAFYTLEVRSGPGDEWRDPCRGGDAVPLAGVWTRTGLHMRDPSRISFACAGSAAYKCTVWGWVAGDDDASLMWRSNQACTRMVRGDFCADGTPHTRDGTLIKIYDYAGVTDRPPARFEGVVNWPPAPGRMFFEAAWPAGDEPATCLSRLRWQSLGVGGLCPTKLRDPRADTTARFCEDLDWPDPGDDPTGALIFNESGYVDLAFHVWESGTDRVGTVRGFYEGASRPVHEPFPAIGTYTHSAVDGMLVRAIREGLDPADFEEVRLFHRPGDAVIAGVSRPPPPEFTTGPEGFEGYVRRARPGPDAEALEMYRHAVTGDYLSLVGPPPAGYERQWTIGYMPPSEAGAGTSAHSRSPDQ